MGLQEAGIQLGICTCSVRPDLNLLLSRSSLSCPDFIPHLIFHPGIEVNQFMGQSPAGISDRKGFYYQGIGLRIKGRQQCL